MRIDSRIFPRFSDDDHISYVSVPQHARRQMRYYVVIIAYDIKIAPPLPLSSSSALKHPRTAESKSENASAKVGTLKPNIFVAKQSERRAVTVTDRYYLPYR